jgi:purine-binding chemotaxis protein CheW
MVDLVKIRKKKAEKKEAEKAELSGHPVVELSGGEEATQQPSNPATQQPDNPTTRQPDNPVESKLDKFKAQAGKRRETQKSAEVDAGPTYIELLTFLIAGEQYAVDIERIIEIVTPRPVTRIPNADPSVVGIMSLRGTIVTLVDVRRKLRHAASAHEDADTRIVVVDFHNEMIGFLVDRVLRVVKATAGEIESHPVVHATELDDSIRGVFRAGGALTILLDLDKLLDSRALATTA